MKAKLRAGASVEWTFWRRYSYTLVTAAFFVDAILRKVDPHAADQIIEELDARYARKNSL